MNNEIYLVKGISGCGKSTRVLKLLQFFRNCGFCIEDYMYQTPTGKNKSVGLLVKELNILFIGKVYIKNGHEVWQGYDSVTDDFGKSEDFTNYLINHKRNHILIIEGSGVTFSYRLRPKFLVDVVGFKNIVIQYYNFPKTEGSRQAYYNRVMERNGKLPKSDAMWLKNNGFHSDYNSAIEDSKTYPCTIYNDTHEPPIDDFGIKFLIDEGLEDFIEDFVIFCNE